MIDGERVCAALLRRTTEEGGGLLHAVSKVRATCRLRFLTGAAAVTYGLPLEFVPRRGGG